MGRKRNPVEPGEFEDPLSNYDPAGLRRRVGAGALRVRGVADADQAFGLH